MTQRQCKYLKGIMFSRRLREPLVIQVKNTDHCTHYSSHSIIRFHQLTCRNRDWTSPRLFYSAVSLLFFLSFFLWYFIVLLFFIFIFIFILFPSFSTLLFILYLGKDRFTLICCHSSLHWWAMFLKIWCLCYFRQSKRCRTISWSGTSRAIASSHGAYLLPNPRGCHLHKSVHSP